MSLEGKTLKVCSCNRTVALDARALAAALKSDAPIEVHHQLCRKDAAAFQAALGESRVGDAVVGKTGVGFLGGAERNRALGEAGIGEDLVSQLPGVFWREHAGQSVTRTLIRRKRAGEQPWLTALTCIGSPLAS